VPTAARAPAGALDARLPEQRQALLRLLRYARGYRRRIAAAVACSTINKLFDIAPEILIGIAIDMVVNREDSFAASLGLTEPGQQIPAKA